MKQLRIILSIVLIILFMGCTSKSYMGEAPKSDSVAMTEALPPVSSSAAVEQHKDSTRKFVRTAELKFKVKSVVKSTYDIEDITVRQGGFVTLTDLRSNIDKMETTHLSADSLLETTSYTVVNTLTLRVPTNRLDTTLKAIAKNIDYLDYRVIKADDVALQILTNNLTLKRSANNEKRLTNAIDERGKKLNETTNAEELLLSKQEQSDNAKIANLSLSDQLRYSTINLSIYQRPAVKREVIANNKKIAEYEPGFFSQIWDSIKFGWSMIAAVIAFLFQLWAFALLGIIVYVIYKKLWPKHKN
jgi:hypothetical protein